MQQTKNLKQVDRNLYITGTLIVLTVGGLLVAFTTAILKTDFAYSMVMGSTWWEYLIASVALPVVFFLGLFFVLIGVDSLSDMRYPMPQAIFAGVVFSYVSLVLFFAQQLYHPGKYILNIIFYNFPLPF